MDGGEMTNIINEELIAAKKDKMIEEESCKSNGKTIVKLTRDNVAKVEAMIRNDSAYIKSHEKKAKPKLSLKSSKKDSEETVEYKYNGSTAYWMSMLRAYILDNKNDFLDQQYPEVKDYFEGLKLDSDASAIDNKLTYDEIIKRAVIAVDNENSTHINSDGVGRDEITRRIVNEIDKKELLNSLWERNLDMFKKIEAKTHPDDVSHNARENTSFASKFCHYACYYLFEGSDKQDNYSIHDNILRTVLPWYLEYYKIPVKKRSLTEYDVYRKAVDAVREKAKEKYGNEISRNGFDHLLWYYVTSLRFLHEV
ncbi:hypothetical protein [Succinimonas sp.]|uniref:hypothetical protein n=1 Tax=Succinimonas sp. TaxID=1936151 RepID=UPI00386DE105